MATVYIQKEGLEHVTLKNDTGADLAQYELTVIGGLVVVADEAIASNAEGSFHIAENIIAQVSDLEAGEDTFATLNAPVYFNPATGDFSDTDTLTYYKVGVVTTVKNANGVVLVLLQRKTSLRSVETAYIAADAVVTSAYEAADAILRAEPRILVQKITADASAGIAVTGLAEGDEIIGVTVICTTANANGTLLLETGAGDDITNGIICAVDKVVSYAGTIDDAFSLLPVTGAQILSVGGTAANTRGIVIITYIPVAV